MQKKGIYFLILLVSFFLGPVNNSFAISTFHQGLTYPTGIAVHPNEPTLYVISGISGSVWSIEIQSNGSAGSLNLLTESFPPNLDIDFDAAGNMYGASGDYIYRLKPNYSVDQCRMRYTTQGSAIAIEKPGLSSNFLFYTYMGSHYSIPFIYVDDYNPNSSTSRRGDLNSCGDFRFFHYRKELNDIVATYGDQVTSVNPGTGSCSTIISGLVQPSGIAVDSSGNVYVADTGNGQILVKDILGTVKTIASGLTSPLGLAYDKGTNVLFISESETGKILKIALKQSSIICEKKIVFGKNPVTNEWAAFLSVCDVPYGWSESNVAPKWFLDGTGLKQPRIPIVLPLFD